MENALLIGLSRQIALHRELEVVANNIANLDTTGYKADGAVFGERRFGRPCHPGLAKDLTRRNGGW